MKHWKNNLLKASKVSTPLITIGGFISDVITPLVEISGVLLSSSIFVFGVSVYFYNKNVKILLNKKKEEGVIDESEVRTLLDENIWAKTLSISAIATIIFSLTWSFSIIYPKKGIIGSNFSIIEDMQEALKLARKNIKISMDIKKDTSDIKNDIKEIAVGIDVIGKGFNLNPNTKGEFFDNIQKAHNKGVGTIEKHVRALLSRYPEPAPDYIAQLLTWSLIKDEGFSYKKAHAKTKKLFTEFGVSQKYASTWEVSVKKRDKKSCKMSLGHSNCNVQNISKQALGHCKMIDFMMGCEYYD